ncbi:DUF397 domain-containing protein [Actinomadura sp. WMMB 499]|uniref:DUF397 domain-containing protein n=1 Tax=Actinomadura sp. WMMB 499 TaxID=1219491 RepID=UPI0012456EB8|nr:DUF397 domain-containing protein [Actinomadura sp. WMMB 499]QFG24757.1 DUF397 domain-containing protein [Actinomadura sp. WMMB 499]
MIHWRKSSHSDTSGNECVEVADLAVGLGVRDSKNPEGGHLTVSRRTFATLLSRIKADTPNA